MGVSGCGKSTLGRRLAAALVIDYLDGDELHPPRNVQRMAEGIALTDADRRDWLAALAARLGEARAAQRGLVVGCSALKRAYRDRLREGAPDLTLVHLHGAPALLAERMATRSGHYMPASLLQSQLDTLEPPQADERAITLDIAWPLERQVAVALDALREATARP